MKLVVSLIVNSCDTLVEKLDKVADSGQIRKSALIHEDFYEKIITVTEIILRGKGKERKQEGLVKAYIYNFLRRRYFGASRTLQNCVMNHRK